MKEIHEYKPLNHHRVVQLDLETRCVLLRKRDADAHERARAVETERRRKETANAASTQELYSPAWSSFVDARYRASGDAIPGALKSNGFVQVKYLKAVIRLKGIKTKEMGKVNQQGVVRMLESHFDDEHKDTAANTTARSREVVAAIS